MRRFIHDQLGDQAADTANLNYCAFWTGELNQQQATDEFIGSAPVSSWHGDRLTDDTTGFLYEIGLLKRYPRTGWALAGVPAAESVAEHSFRASIIAATLAAAEDADPQRAAFLALWHDTQETRTTDLPT